MIKILDATHRPIQHIGKMAGVCYGSNIEDETINYNRGLDCVESNHNRTFEYVDVTMEIDGYSNRVIRELYTHIIGVTRLQESTRYVDMSKRFTEYYTPKSIQDNPEALEAYNDTMWVIQDAYEFLIAHGVPKQDAGNLVPLGQHTKIVLKINLEALFHMFETRTCTRVLPEFRELMNEMRGALSDIDNEWNELSKKHFVTKCVRLGFCPESKSCGRYPKKNEYKIVDIKPFEIPYTDPLKQWRTLEFTGIDKMLYPVTTEISSNGLVSTLKPYEIVTTSVIANATGNENTYPTNVGDRIQVSNTISNAHLTPYKPIQEREEFWDVSSTTQESLEQFREAALKASNSIEELSKELSRRIQPSIADCGTYE